jgi:hypothetical protein
VCGVPFPQVGRTGVAKIAASRSAALAIHIFP